MSKNNQKLQPYFKSGKFYNSQRDSGVPVLSYYSFLITSFLHEMTIFLKSLKNGNSRLPKNINDWVSRSPILPSSIEPAITWIGHASFLIQIGGFNILTDPIFGSATLLYPRIVKPGIDINDLPKIDYVIISHNHLDHMDEKSLLALKSRFKDIKILVPYGNKKWFEERNFLNSFEFLWWEQVAYKPENNFLDLIKFTFVPAHHWSQRTMFDQNKSLWGSWMIECNGQSIYFAGDTSYSGHFSAIAKEFPVIDIALMPIGPCEPRAKMCRSHIDSHESIKAFLDLQAKHFIPMHWGTFHFGLDLFDTPIVKLLSEWHQNMDLLRFTSLHIVKFGQCLKFSCADLQVPISKQKPLESSKQ